MDLGLGGRRAFVSGATTGIGAAIARRLAAEGALVVVHGRDATRAAAIASAIVEAGGHAECLLGPLSTAGEAGVLADRALEGGPIDIVVNNVGGRTDSNTVDWERLLPDHWLRTYELNVLSPAVLASRFAQGMRERGWGRVVQISSVAALFARPDTADYSASKAALNNVTVSLSQALSGTGVTVNTVSPGATRTVAVEAVIVAQADRNGWVGTAAEIEKQATAARWQNTSQRLGEPEEIAAVVALVASEAGGYINGANIRVDGGRPVVV